MKRAIAKYLLIGLVVSLLTGASCINYASASEYEDEGTFLDATPPDGVTAIGNDFYFYEIKNESGKTLKTEITYYGGESVATLPSSVEFTPQLVISDANGMLKKLIIPQNISVLYDGNIPSVSEVVFEGNVDKVYPIWGPVFVGQDRVIFEGDVGTIEPAGSAIPAIEEIDNLVFMGNVKKMSPLSVAMCGNDFTMTAKKGTAAYEYAMYADIPVVLKPDVSFENKKLYLLVGDNTGNILCNNIDEVTWISSNPKVVTVNEKGRLLARKKGKATITAKVGTDEYSYPVTVYKSTLKNRIKAIKNGVVNSSMSDYEKIFAVHKWMVTNIDYDYENYRNHTIPKQRYTTKGALLDKICVCDGYTNGFLYIMSELGIPCKKVVGSVGAPEPHSWNQIKIGGKWYHIDVTWGDSEREYSGSRDRVSTYEYFLKSDEYLKKHHHQWSSDYKGYKKCSSKKYDGITTYYQHDWDDRIEQ